MVNEPLVYNVKEAASLLNLSKNSCYTGIMRGDIPHIKIGKRILIPKLALEKLLRDCEGKEIDNG